MAKQDLRKMKEDKKVSNDDAVKMAEDMLGKKIDVSQKDMSDIEKITEQAKKYEGKSEEELTHELLRVAEQGKKDGSINNEMLETFYRSMAPMMSNDQKNKLDNLMKMLKG